MGCVDANLYEFLRENENHLYIDDEEVTAWAAINFYSIANFTTAVGGDCFTEGIDCTLKDGYIAVDLKEIIVDWFGQNLSDYKKCFPESEWVQYGDELLKQEKGDRD